MRRQPEVGSAIGLTTDEVVARARCRHLMLRDVRRCLTSALARALTDLQENEKPIDVALELDARLEEVFERWRD